MTSRLGTGKLLPFLTVDELGLNQFKRQPEIFISVQCCTNNGCNFNSTTALANGKQIYLSEYFNCTLLYLINTYIDAKIGRFCYIVDLHLVSNRNPLPVHTVRQIRHGVAGISAMLQFIFMSLSAFLVLLLAMLRYVKPMSRIVVVEV